MSHINELIDFMREKMLSYRKLDLNYFQMYSLSNISKNVKLLAPSDTIDKIILATMLEEIDKKDLLKLVVPWFANPVLNQKNAEGWTPLTAASYMGDIEKVKILVSQPVIDINVTGGQEEATALHYASSMGHVEIVRLLSSLPEIDINKRDKHKKTPYYAACKQCADHEKSEKIEKIREILDVPGLEKEGGKRKRTYKKRAKKTKKGRSRRR
jgi:ankyrin repeat protein